MPEQHLSRTNPSYPRQPVTSVSSCSVFMLGVYCDDSCERFLLKRKIASRAPAHLQTDVFIPDGCCWSTFNLLWSGTLVEAVFVVDMKKGIVQEVFTLFYVLVLENTRFWLAVRCPVNALNGGFTQNNKKGANGGRNLRNILKLGQIKPQLFAWLDTTREGFFI